MATNVSFLFLYSKPSEAKNECRQLKVNTGKDQAAEWDYNHRFLLCFLRCAARSRIWAGPWPTWDVGSVRSVVSAPVPASPCGFPQSSLLTQCWPLTLPLPFVWGACIYFQWTPITHVSSRTEVLELGLQSDHEFHFAYSSLIISSNFSLFSISF